MFSKLSLITALVSSVSAGSILWDGRFNDVSSNADIAKWSWSNQVGPYQYYIHGSGSIDKYVNLSPSFRNPADTSSKQGAKITIDSTSHWNGQNMFRTELIPSTSAAINKGKVFYHFSVKTSATNAPIKSAEHQVAFFESHFTELKFGGDAGNKLQWHVGGQSKWETELVADEWHNVAYEIDFSGGSVTFWHSTGAAALTKTAGPITASPSSDGKDFHVGVLRLPDSANSDATEDWYFSGVYVESGEITTSVSGPGAAAGGDTPAASSAPAATPAPAASSAAAAASSSVVAEVKTPMASSTPAAAMSSAAPMKSSAVAPKPMASSTFATSYMSKPTPSPASPAPSAGSGSGSGSGSNAPLPKEFTLNEFIAWLKAKNGIN